MSTFAEKPGSVGPDHLKELLQHAVAHVPKEAIPETPIFLLATAGVRLLPTSQRKDLLAQICSYARLTTDFQLPDCDLHIQAISGETEGLYGWIAANYLLGGFDAPEEHDHGKDHHTYGFLEMGGASAQIAFAPNATEAEKHANDLTLLRMRTLDGEAAEYRVFVTTWLKFGVNEARKRYVEALLKATGTTDAKELPDPCLPVGLNINTKGDVLLPGSKTVGDNKTPDLIGTGDFDKCLKQTIPLLDKDAPCEDEPCLLHGVHVPAIDFDVNHFVGVSEYWHTTHEVFEHGHKDKAYDFNTYQNRVKEFCSQDWKAIEEGIGKHTWGKKVDEKIAVEVCFKASWLINILHEGIGIPRVGLENTEGSGHNGTKEVLDHAKEKGFTESFQAVDKIGDTEVSWTLGKMVLYASSQIPPHDSKSPVGFGSNTPSIPPDFQYAGSPTSTFPTNISTSPNIEPDTNGDHWHDTLFRGSSPRRIPGFLLFLLILCVATFLLCGRDRRQRLYRKFRSFPRSSSSPRRKRNLLAGKIPFLRPSSSGAGSYERVLEDGTAHTDFELGSLDDDSDDNEASDSSGASKTSGWATPRVQVQGLDTPSMTFSGGGEYFGSRPGSSTGQLGQGIGLGIGLNPMSRSGLVGRTESKDWLVGMVGVGDGGGGKRSRRGSPSRRGKSPGMGTGMGRVVED